MENKKEKKTKKVKEKRKFSAKEMFANENYGNGLRCVIICALAILLVVGVNMMMTALPTKAADIDVSISRIHSISSETEETIRDLDQDVDIYLVCQSGEEDKNTIVMLDLYADLSDRLNVSQVDPAFDPSFVQNYTGDDTVSDNTVIVASGDKRQVLTPSDYRSGSTFVLEDYLNSAIDFVTSDEYNMVYALTGHGENSLSDTMVDYLGLDGFQVEEISLIETGAIPDDARGIIINGATEDITEREAEILLDYLQNGGRLLLSTGYINSTYPNIETVTTYYGARLERGYVVEGDESHYIESNPTYILPYVITDTNTILTDGVAYALMPSAKGIILDDDIRDTVEVSPVLETTDSAYTIYTNIFTNSTETFEGPYYLGVSFSEETDNGESRLVWFSSSAISNASIDAYVGGSNVTMFLNAVCWICEDEPVPSIHGKSTSTQFLTVDTAALRIWRYVMIFIVPLLVIAIGVVIYVRRRRKG